MKVCLIYNNRCIVHVYSHLGVITFFSTKKRKYRKKIICFIHKKSIILSIKLCTNVQYANIMNIPLSIPFACVKFLFMFLVFVHIKVKITLQHQEPYTKVVNSKELLLKFDLRKYSLMRIKLFC